MLGRVFSPTPPLLIAAVLFTGAGATPGGGQDVSRNTLPADTIVPIPLPPLEVRVLLSPLQLRETPYAVSVSRRTDRADGDAGAFLEGALQALPGLQIQNRYNFAVGEKVILRGLGARAQFGVRGLQISVDDIPATLPDGQSTLDHLDLMSMGQIELLRGPASSLYGNGAGGVLRFETKAPPDRPLSEEATLTAGSHGLLQVTSITAGTLDRTGYLLSLGALEYGGYRDNPQVAEGVFGAAHRRILNGHLRRELGNGSLKATLNILDLDAENPGSIQRSPVDDGSREASAFNVIQATGKEVTQGQLGLSWSGNLREWQATLTGFGILRNVWNPIPPAVIDLERQAGGLRGLLQGEAGLGDLRLRWTTGAEVGSQTDIRRNFRNQEGIPGPLTLDQREEVLGAGVFFQALLEFPRRANLLAGIRYDRTRFRVEDRFTGAGNPDDSGRRIMDAVSPSLGFTVPLAEGLVARGSVSTFYQTPTTSELANQPFGAGGFNPSLGPQRGTTLEGGLRVFRDGRFQVEATYFRTRVTDELVPFEIPDAPGRAYFRNAGRSHYRGLELSGTARLTGGFRLRSAYTVLDAKSEEFMAGSEDLGGKRVPGVARHSLEGLLTWEVARTAGKPSTFTELRVRYQGSVFVDDRNSDSTAPYTLMDLRGGIRQVGVGGVGWAPFAGVTNLFDRQYVTSVSVNAFGGRSFDPGPPRAYYFGVAATLGLKK